MNNMRGDWSVRSPIVWKKFLTMQNNSDIRMKEIYFSYSLYTHFST
jgi:hypothetical protein